MYICEYYVCMYLNMYAYVCVQIYMLEGVCVRLKLLEACCEFCILIIDSLLDAPGRQGDPTVHPVKGEQSFQTDTHTHVCRNMPHTNVHYNNTHWQKDNNKSSECAALRRVPFSFSFSFWFSMFISISDSQCRPVSVAIVVIVVVVVFV